MDLVESVTVLEARHDEFPVLGSLDLLSSLLHFGLVDRMSLRLFPVLLGSGKRVLTGPFPRRSGLTEWARYPGGHDLRRAPGGSNRLETGPRARMTIAQRSAR